MTKERGWFGPRRKKCLAWAAMCWALALSVTALAAESPPAPATKPNVIIVLSDDQGYGDFSCLGNPVLKTPQLDRLHNEAIRLTDFHVAPMCTPTRGQLMTGQDALRNGAMSVCAGRSFIRRGTPTMGEIFAASGYRTAHFGKWHLGDSYPNLPHQRGFEETVYHLGWGITSISDHWENDCFNGHFYHNGKLQQYPGYCTDVWFNLAMDWMKGCQQRREPFFLYLPTNAVHTPHWVEDKYKAPYRGQGPEAFFGMMANLDENMGRLQDFLRDTGLADNTILIYFHDNGGTSGVKVFNAGMRGHKTEYYEGGHRAACFLRWPAGQLQAPSDIGGLTEVQDLLPTLIEFCGLRAPPQARLDGISLVGLLRGAGFSLPDRTLVVQYGQRPKKWECAVLWDRWRLVAGRELYDLVTDPGQVRDLAGERPLVAAKMREYYEQWWAGIEPSLDDFSPVIIGSEHENPVRLSSVDWANVYCDNMKRLREGQLANGAWNVRIEQSGRYEISLRRWPEEADASIAGGVPEFKAVDGNLPPGKALPIVKVRLKIGDFDETRSVSSEDKQVTFTLDLEAIDKTQLQSWCYDAAGQELCGAYFAYVRRK